MTLSLGILFGTLGAIDLVLFKIKNTTSLLKYGLFLTIPVFTSLVYPIIAEWVSGDAQQVNLQYLYVSFLFTATLVLGIIYFSIYLPMMRRHPLSTFDYLDYIKLGHSEYKEALRNEPVRHENILININKNTPKYVDGIYLLLSDVDDEFDLKFEEILVFSLFTFIEMFLDNNHSRFTIRVLNEKTLTMETIKTTRDDSPPGDIVLSERNSISRSMNEGKPILYSRNKDEHQSTVQNSLHKGIYDEYVSYCLMTKEINGEHYPLFNVCIDVKGKELSEKLSVLIDQPVFKIMCERLSEKLNAEEFLNNEKIKYA